MKRICHERRTRTTVSYAERAQSIEKSKLKLSPRTKFESAEIQKERTETWHCFWEISRNWTGIQSETEKLCTSSNARIRQKIWWVYRELPALLKICLKTARGLILNSSLMKSRKFSSLLAYQVEETGKTSKTRVGPPYFLSAIPIFAGEARDWGDIFMILRVKAHWWEEERRGVRLGLMTQWMK